MLHGFLQVGPAYYPPRSHGVQIIQRGPHGHRFAADPVESKSGKARGSGFRWWKEQMLSAGDYKGSWQPEQEVQGVMGMGALPDSTELTQIPPGTPAPPAFPVPAPRDPARQVYAELQRAVGAAARGRIDAARSFATDGVNFFMRNVPAQDRGVWEANRQRALAYIEQVRVGAKGRLAAQEAKEQRYTSQVQQWNTDTAPMAQKITAAEVAAARRGQASYAASIFGGDPFGAVSAAATGRAPADWSSGERLGVRADAMAAGDCVGFDPACWTQKHWWKAALLVGGLVFLKRI